mgnify:CR=1 FL=1
MTEQEMNTYGMSEADIRKQHMNSLTANLAGLEMVVMGILSDAQYMLEMKQPNQSRKMMNVAKFILSEMLAAKRETAHGSLS